MKSIIQILGFIVIVGGSFLFGVAVTWVYRTKYLREKPKEIPSIIEIQEMVGANPDGIVGSETIRKWEIAYANQEANKFMTPSGGPKEIKCQK